MTLNDIIKKYPKIFQLMNNPMYRISSDVPESWLETIDLLCESIQNYIDKHNEINKHLSPINQLICTQVKEKFGILNFYHTDGNDVCDGMIRMATTILLHTCEYCGSHKNVGRENNPYWIRYVCEDCNKKLLTL